MSKKVLLVEDEKNIILGVCTCLEAVGYEVHVVEDGETALKYMQDNKPDMVLLDIMLPMADGFEVCRVLKNNPETRTIPIIILTAKAGAEDRQRALEAGADSYMTKPFRPRELWDEIKKFLPEK